MKKTIMLTYTEEDLIRELACSVKELMPREDGGLPTVKIEHVDTDESSNRRLLKLSIVITKGKPE